MREARPARGPDREEMSGGDLRTFLALERTFLAWIRTGLSLVAIGLVVARFGLLVLPGQGRPWGTGSGLLGSAMAGSGGVLLASSGYYYLRQFRRLQRAQLRPSPLWTTLLTVWLSLVALLLTIYVILRTMRY